MHDVHLAVISNFLFSIHVQSESVMNDDVEQLRGVQIVQQQPQNAALRDVEQHQL